MPQREPPAQLPRLVRFWRLLFVLLLAGSAVGAEAQLVITVSTQPSAPTTFTPVTLSVFNSCGCPQYTSPIVVDGFVIDVPYGCCCLSACLASTVHYPLGLLPAGTYTVRQFFEGEPATAEVIGEFTVAVGEAAIPTLDARGALALALVVVLLALRRLL